MTITAAPGAQPVLAFTGATSYGIGTQKAAWVVIEGLRLVGPSPDDPTALLAAAEADYLKATPSSLFNMDGIRLDGRNQGASHPHHFTIRNCSISRFSGGGIACIQTDYLTVEDNRVFDNCWYNRWANSGISTWQNWNYDAHASGYAMVIRRNTAFNNFCQVKWIATKAYSDGNGIIIDDSLNTQNGSTLGAYTGRTLVCDNLVVGNGGSGIHAYRSERVDIVRNTSYRNSVKLDYGEIFAISSNQVVMWDNLLHGRPGRKITAASGNTAVTYDYNIYAGNGGVAVLGVNDKRTDPGWVSPSSDPAVWDFTLRADSPARDSASTTFADVSPGDLGRRTRPRGAGGDRGAYEAVPLYRITYEGNGSELGTVPAAQTKTEGVDLSLAANSGGLARAGFTFAGWNTSTDGSGTTYVAGALYGGDAPLILYASWAKIVDTTAPSNLPGYPIILDVSPRRFSTRIRIDEPGTGYWVLLRKGAPDPGPVAVKKGQDGNGSPAVKSGMATLLANTEVVVVIDGLEPSTDYVVWVVATDIVGNQQASAISCTVVTAAAPTYRITYEGNGSELGTVPAAQTKTEGVDLTLAANSGGLARAGFTFAGWNTSADGSGTTYVAGALYGGDASLILYANWAKIVDTTAPSNLPGYPVISNPSPRQFSTRIRIDEPGTGYWVLLRKGAPDPGPVAVKKGQDGNGSPAVKSGMATLLANTEVVVVIDGLEQATDYVVWVVATDAVGNLQASAISRTITTAPDSGGGSSGGGAVDSGGGGGGGCGVGGLSAMALLGLWSRRRAGISDRLSNSSASGRHRGFNGSHLH